MWFMVPSLLWTCILCGCAGANTESTTEGLPVAGPRVIQNGSPPPQWTFFPLPSKTTTPQNIVAGPDDGNMWFIEATGSSLDKIGITTGHIKRFPTSVPLTLLGLALGPDSGPPTGRQTATVTYTLAGAASHGIGGAAASPTEAITVGGGKTAAPTITSAAATSVQLPPLLLL